ncbi:MAG: OS_HP3 family (seleno)protein, partial [Desulfobacterales bacterium]
EVTAKNGKFINYELTRRCTEGNDKCVIRVENKRNEKGRYYDVLYVRTDSKHRPELSIHVVGMIR